MPARSAKRVTRLFAFALLLALAARYEAPVAGPVKAISTREVSVGLLTGPRVIVPGDCSR